MRGCNPVRLRLQRRAPQAATPSHVCRYSGESADELGPKLLEELQFVRDAFHPGPNLVPCTLDLDPNPYPYPNPNPLTSALIPTPTRYATPSFARPRTSPLGSTTAGSSRRLTLTLTLTLTLPPTLPLTPLAPRAARAAQLGGGGARGRAARRARRGGGVARTPAWPKGVRAG